jgi:ATP-dependent Lon protease
MEVLELTGYSEEEKVHIARRYLIPRQAAENGLPADALAITDGAMHRIIAEYTREAGVRSLERRLGAIARKHAAKIATAAPTDAGAAASPAIMTVDAADVPAYLGPPRMKPDTEFRLSRPGVATGVAWTESGGEVLYIEAVLLSSGGGNLTLTGQLGAVMQESARAALSHVRQQALALGLKPDFLTGHELHLHIPAGAIPKDGPSAGVTMATAIVSAARQQSVSQNVAMTGEITLTGLVLPVGGIREKVLAARRHGIKTFILPEANLSDLEELPEDVRKSLTFVPARTLDDVLRVALPLPVPDETPLATTT